MTIAEPEPAGPPLELESDSRRKTQQQTDRNRLAVNALLAASVTRNLAISVRNLSEQQIWLDAYSGDFGAQARAQGLLESVSGILGFILNPILGGISDSMGRKPLMNFAPVALAMGGRVIKCAPPSTRAHM